MHTLKELILKNIFISLFTLAILTSACKKEDEVVQQRDVQEQAIEDNQTLEAYLETHFYNYKDFENPDFKGAIVFGMIYTVILLLVSYANENLGEKGTLISSAIAGFSDIDAITISISKLAGESLDLRISAFAILIAVISNTLIKMGIGIYAGSKALRKNLLIGYGTMFLTALISFFLI